MHSITHGKRKGPMDTRPWEDSVAVSRKTRVCDGGSELRAMDYPGRHNVAI